MNILDSDRSEEVGFTIVFIFFIFFFILYTKFLPEGVLYLVILLSVI